MKKYDAAAQLDAEPQKLPNQKYKDGDGNYYYVRQGLGEVYKGFKWTRVRRKGQRRDRGMQALKYVVSKEQAQAELDQYARNKGWHTITEEDWNNRHAVAEEEN